MADNKNNIDKALEALTGALEIEPTGEEVQLEPDKGVSFEPDVELMDDGGAEINMDPNAPIDTSNIPHDANLAEYIEENELGMGMLLPAFRLSLTGLGMGPSLFDIASLLGKKETTQRMKTALEKIN